jgi:hypothetical protein
MHIDKATAATATHDRLGAVRFSVRELGAWPDAQVGQTIGLMRQRVSEDAQAPEFQQWAGGVCGNGTQLEQVANAYAHTKGSLRFERDELNAARLAGTGINPDDVIEVIIRPLDMKRYVELGLSVGDCDDYSMYLAALLEAVGIPCAFVTVAADATAPYQYSHVYVAAYPHIDGTSIRIPLDASHGSAPGWEAEQAVEVRRKTEWGISGGIAGGLEWMVGAIGYTLVAMGVWWTGKKWGWIA